MLMIAFSICCLWERRIDFHAIFDGAQAGQFHFPGRFAVWADSRQTQMAVSFGTNNHDVTAIVVESQLVRRIQRPSCGAQPLFCDRPWNEAQQNSILTCLVVKFHRCFSAVPYNST
jgi:hypothetical protein